MIEIKYFLIRYFGDESVGIFPAEWKVTGDFFFEDNAELETFKSKLEEAWAYCSDVPVSIQTDEEIEKQERQYKNLEEETNTNQIP